MTNDGSIEATGTSPTAGRPLNILIAGAGLGGLTAGIALRRAGHTVTVFEQSRLASETGAAINVPPNAYGVLLQLGVDPIEAGAVEFKWKYILAHRVDLHTQLKTAATGADGVGTPVKLVTGARVVDVDMDNAVVTLGDGSTATGDMVIGADGIQSRTRAKLTGNLPFPSGKSAYRFLLNKADVLRDPHLAEFVQKDCEMKMWFDVSRRIVMYPTRENDILNFVCIHPDTGSADGDQTWNKPGRKQELIDTFEDFDKRALALMAMADESSLKVWKLVDMDPVDQWCGGKFCLLGDAAHPFLPHQGQGGAQAIEDGASLGILFPLGTQPHEIPARLHLYQECRKERAEIVQEATRQSGADITPGKHNNSAKVLQFFYYNCGHDEQHHSAQKLRDWMYKENSKACWQMPISFGPSPGQRQDLGGRNRQTSNSSFITRTIKFKTSRTLLQNLLPSTAYSFVSPATFATASYVQTTLSGIDWLGGQGYNTVGLHLHGVQYKKKDASMVNGDYLVVVWEDLPDSIIRGREELGIPKLFADVNVKATTSSTTMEASWRKTTFLTLDLQDLEDGPSDPPSSDAILAHKYLPATGRPGVADVEYPILVSSAKDIRITKSQKAAHCSIKLNAHDEKTLPTLHHAITRLAELPIHEILGGTVVEGTGLQDMSLAERLESSMSSTPLQRESRL